MSRTVDWSSPCRAQPVGERILLAPLGVPLRIDLLGIGHPDRIVSACRGWDARPEPSVAPLHLSLASDRTLAGIGPTELEVRGRLLTLGGSGARGGACADSGEAWCAVSSEFLFAPDRLRAEVLDPLVLFLAARRGRVPLHAAAIECAGLAILLMGPSGAGKSSLALAADRAGWTVLAEDTVFVQRESSFKVRGLPGPAHLLPCDSGELSAGVRFRNGKLKQAIPLRNSQPGWLVASRATVCLLDRGEAVGLDRVEPFEALRQMGRLESGFDLLADDIRAVSELLARDGAWRLTLSTNPAEAIECLADNLPRLQDLAV